MTARETVFYPGITKDIKNRLVSCDTCQTFQKAVDYLSGYFEIDQLESKRIQDVIYCLKVHMMRYGKCDELISDNSLFQAAEFKRFAELYEFKHIPSSPRYPISDGKTELAVGTCKKIVMKAAHDHKDVYLALFDFQNTPGHLGLSSPQIMFNRRTKTRLMMALDLLKSQFSHEAHSKPVETNLNRRFIKIEEPKNETVSKSDRSFG